jgi:ATP-dependent Clp protease protease subunit
MDEETWMNANKAIELGFADDILRDEKKQADVKGYAFSTKQVATALLNKVAVNKKETIKNGRTADEMLERLFLIK